MKVLMIAALIMVVSVFLFGCDINSTIQTTESSVNAEVTADTVAIKQLIDRNPLALIKYYVQILTSETFAGRMAGTLGNDLAVEWLSARLYEIGIESYSEHGYKMGFDGWSNTFLRSNMMMVFPDGSTRILEQGVDFFISLGEGSFSVMLESSGESFVVVPPSESGRARISDPSADYFVYFVSNGSFWNAAGSQSIDRAFRDKQVQLSNEIYEIIKNGAFDRIAITNTVNYEKMELYHVVGRIRGDNPANAVVISAHFDHVGQGGATFFPGALDNASGTAALLYIAERLMIASETHLFDFDIVIAFFNSEEHLHNGRPLGSQYFVPIVQADYENVWNINIDVVGSSADETFLAGGSASSALREAFTDFAKQYGAFIDNSQFTMSDNINFTAMGIPSFNFLSGDFLTTGIAHTNLDTYDRLYFPQILRIADMIVEFLLQDGVSVFEADELVSMPSPPTIEPTDGNRQERFERIFNAVIAGEQVSFYEEFYRYFPEEEMRFFSYYEAIEIDETFLYIRDFGMFRLKFMSYVQGSRITNFTYSRVGDGNQFDLRIRPVQIEDIDAVVENMQLEVIDIPDLYGYSALLFPDTTSFAGFKYNDGSRAFIVMQGRSIVFSHPIRNAMSSGIMNESVISEL
ncbi:MAG: M28 family metallopeptidase, partial [Oscillospiraceae bacterium]|nr:M28 family metallopeptidase [Oscillospiraceae bacterium]